MTMRFRLKHLLVLFYCWLSWPVFMTGQPPDSLVNPIDTLPTTISPVPLTPTPVTFSGRTLFSPDSLDAPVEYDAQDSMIYDIENEIIHLYGNASVKYEATTVTADYIAFDWNNNIATAMGPPDGIRVSEGKPVKFDDGTQSFDAEKLEYNFKTYKGKVYEVKTQEGDGFLLSGVTLFDQRSQREDEADDVAYSGSTIYTTCNLDHPHFGVHSKKAKIIPNKLIVVGPSNIKINNVPTPLFLPFGFFPITKGQRSGVLFPQDYEFSETLGFGLRGVGYYFGINDYIDLSLTTEFFTRGSWGVTARSNYVKRYKFRGGYSVSYSERRFGQKNTPDFSLRRDFLVSWNHSQDSKAHPSRRFSANMRFGTGTFLTNNNNDAESVLTNTLNSNVSITKSFPGKPYNLSASFSHSQNTQTRLMNISFPVADFRVNQVFPFKRKKSSGKERFYEKIGIRYSTKLQNRVQIADTLLFTDQLFDELEYGMEHQLPVSATFKIFKFFNLSPSVNYQEYWYLETLQKTFDPTLIIENDTIFNADGTEINQINRDTTFGTIVDQDIFGFRSQRRVSGSLGISTQIFGTARFRKGRVQFRHVIKPTVSMSITPDYTRAFWGYFDSVQVSTLSEERIQYSIFDGGIYPTPPTNRQAALTFNIGNTLEAKVPNRRDSTEAFKKLRLINAFNIRGSYNFAADSLRMSTISMSGNTRILKVININAGAVFDPYSLNSEGRRVNVSQWSAKRRLLRFTSGNVTISTRLDPNQISELFRSNDDQATANNGPPGNNNNRQNNSRFPIRTLNLNYSLRFAARFVDGEETIEITTNSLSLSGTSVNLTKKWSIRIGNIGYDFKNKRVTYPDFGFYRDLHCWEMGLDWQPVNRTYSFYLRVKPGTLDFLSIPYRRNQFDPFGF